MTKLDKHHITLFQGIIDFLPTIFVDIGACGTSCLRLILEDTLGGVKNGVGLTAPPPHAVGFVVLVLACGVATEEDHRLACLTTLVTSLGNHFVVETSLEKSELRVIRSQNALSCTGCIHAGTISG